MSLVVHRFLFLWRACPRTGFLLGFSILDLLVEIFDMEKSSCCVGSMVYDDMVLAASLEAGC
jgi:hypothetical protein